MSEVATKASAPDAGTPSVRQHLENVGFPVDLPKPRVWLSRFVWAILFLAPTAVMLTAMTLTPSPLGHGTHTQLGLPPCGFLLFTGLPCPGCGLTTSFAHMIRFQVVGAAQANPFGIALFLASFATIPVSAIGFFRGEPVLEALDRYQADKIAIMLAVVSVTVWVARVLTILVRAGY